MSAHALCSPSSAAMWMNCPASVTKAEGRVRPSSKYAREGTAAHAIAEDILNNGPFPPQRVTIEGEEIIVSRDMLVHLRGYINLIEYFQNLGATVLIEQRVGLTFSKGLLWGTADCVALNKTKTTLAIVDLKYGKGVAVSPDTPQLKIYALGAMEKLAVFPSTIQMTVVQPRIDPKPQTHIMSFAEIMDWTGRELHPALDRIHEDDKTEVAGPWCRWCVRRNECAAYAKKTSGVAADLFDDGVDLTTL